MAILFDWYEPGITGSTEEKKDSIPALLVMVR